MGIATSWLSQHAELPVVTAPSPTIFLPKYTIQAVTKAAAMIAIPLAVGLVTFGVTLPPQQPGIYVSGGDTMARVTTTVPHAAEAEPQKGVSIPFQTVTLGRRVDDGQFFVFRPSEAGAAPACADLDAQLFVLHVNPYSALVAESAWMTPTTHVSTGSQLCHIAWDNVAPPGDDLLLFVGLVIRDAELPSGKTMYIVRLLP